jgi:hypothetical protein
MLTKQKMKTNEASRLYRVTGHTLLVYITKLRVSVAKILCVGQPVVALAQVALPVLPLAVSDTRAGQETDADLGAQVDGVASGVPRCVMDGVYPEMR